MRFITIDKLKAIIGQWYHFKHLETFKFPKSISITDLLELIETVPTMDVIPVKWIEKFMNRFRCNDVISDEYALLHFMLTEWEKENEVNRH